MVMYRDKPDLSGLYGCLFVVVFVLALCLVNYFTGGSDDGARSADGTARPDDVTIKQVGRDRLRATLREPDSLEIIEERLVRPARNGGEVGYYVKYRAKNGFGGYAVDEFYTE
jgi:hypothetical protein